MMRGVKEIRRDFNAICRMSDAAGRLGFELSESQNGQFWAADSYDTVGSSLISVVENNPEHIDLIEDVVVAITGFGFGSIREHMKDHKSHYESLL